MNGSTPYSEDYFELIEAQSDSSAAAVVPLLCQLLEPVSVVDVGCGAGTWLKYFRQHGILDVAGMDGHWVDRSSLAIPRSCFDAVDLSSPPRATRRFDLVVSLEVAEHLPAESAARFVDFLVELGPAVAFSAAIPSQGGTGHVNEQWPDYWRALFARHGYVPHDVVRPRIWLDDRVAWWFRQNLIVYVDRERAGAYGGLLDRPDPAALPLVHPELYCRHVGAEPPRAVTDAGDGRARPRDRRPAAD